MAGIFPQAGTQAQNAQNAQVGVQTVEGCDPLFYRTNCNVRFDPISTNAILSEISNVVNAAGIDYDCSRLDNMAQAIAALANLCNLDTAAPDADDLIAGCIDGSSKLVTVLSLLGLAPNIFTAGPISDNDYIGFADTEGGGVARKVLASSLKSYVLGGGGGFPAIAPGAAIAGGGGQDQQGSFNLSGYTAAVIQCRGEGLVEIGGRDFAFHGNINIPRPWLFGVNQGSGSIASIGGIFALFKKNGTWYVVDNGVGLALSGGDNIQWDQDGNVSFAVYSGTII